jgi:hypothetical protein
MEGNQEQAVKVFTSKCIPSRVRIVKQIENLIAATETDAQESRQRAEAIYISGRLILLGSVTDIRGCRARRRQGWSEDRRPNLDGKATREDAPATLDL